MKPNTGLLSVPDAATLCGISRSAAYRWAKDGALPVVRSGRTVKVPLVGLARYLQMTLGELRSFIDGSAEQ
jgi:excisionase family DNA binding protein